ncbi:MULTISPECIES: restriction endonuclease [Pectobacterium]|uniref:restriction endonuclease n=1 Tax=Pectobacterium TaxID=122277 RepID=UPI00101D802F|nr:MULTISPECIES: restriction endonuclease [Pectobacterium]MBN3189499.1 restriction endonuclease [Pectobacterium brasiliense]RYC43072.1 restriction endonuclease [Pectobacterium zantedeschiae]
MIDVLIEEQPLMLGLAEKSVNNLYEKYKKKLEVNPDLDRKIVSFQANKIEPIFRWFHYREGFSKQLIEYILKNINIPSGGKILDPFAGTGVAPFVAEKHNNMDGIAIELMPVGTFFMQCRNEFSKIKNEDLICYARKALESRNEWLNIIPEWEFKHLKITEGAFSYEDEKELCQFKTWLSKIEDKSNGLFLDFIAFSILEKFSFTRKDGQYLRWDHRSPRFINASKKTTFDKGEVLSFFDALREKLEYIIEDLGIEESKENKPNDVKILQGSVLKVIDELEDNSLDAIITSPPYCNRYDYTRTYALELAYLGIDEENIRLLRQTLLTCTVENKPKHFEWLSPEDKLYINQVFDKQHDLLNLLTFLDIEAKEGRLNNKGIATMVRGYFYDSAVHLFQVSKKMKSGGYYIMVNDNVKYNGLEIPVDLILSEIANEFSLKTEKIWVLPKGKGNSSQQMKKHGRTELRKCVYIWKKA